MFISPMLLQKIDRPFNDPSWISELKLDGIRCLISKFDSKVSIYSRHNNEISSMFPELTDLPIQAGTILDGELIVSNDQGKPDFEAVMERFKSRKSLHDISYCVFDILYFKGKKVTSLPLLERKQILSEIIREDTKLLTKVNWIEGNGEAFFDLIKQQDLEGIVLKKSDSKYQIDKRSYDWLKVINYKYGQVYISGIRKNAFGLLLNFENGQYAGILEFMKPAARKEFYKVYRDLITGENDKFIYLDPKLRIKIKYRNLTKNGLLRIPSFVDWAV